ncbi:hypothetical protein MSG28_012546 [Choristoneura fumiferana]|uniref:Uncharacterized protein n=1 Tax=Choristoneura fumiferana TaxID=7141 RepID=A0ACC0JGW6_CHOFU|nr:hypothetical protein MSG28_012546 [Choristoneura fumiferana]
MGQGACVLAVLLTFWLGGHILFKLAKAWWKEPDTGGNAGGRARQLFGGAHVARGLQRARVPGRRRGLDAHLGRRASRHCVALA